MASDASVTFLDFHIAENSDSSLQLLEKKMDGTLSVDSIYLSISEIGCLL